MPTNPTEATGQRSLRATWLEIDLAAVVHNYKLARSKVAPGVGVFPVVKADGYGLGALPIAEALLEAGAEGVCVALLEEAEQLRRGGVTQPIVLLSGLTSDVAPSVLSLGVQPFVYNLECLSALSQATNGRDLSLFLKVDTGMARLGIAWEDLPKAIALIADLPGLVLGGVVSHLACADEPERPENGQQLALFRKLLSHFDSTVPMGRASLANSAGLLMGDDWHFDWVRPGIMLYGVSPFFPHRSWESDGLKPVVTWCTHCVQVRTVPADTPIGYGHTFVTSRPSTIAYLPVGYADGYNRFMSGQAEVLIEGKRVPVVAIISMDLTAVDVTGLDSVVTGTKVTLLGQDGEAFIGVEEMAIWCDTIPYEVLCRLGQRLGRCYLPA